MKKNLTVIRNILYRLFLIGFVLSILIQLPLLHINFEGLNEAAQIFHISPDQLMMVVLNSISFAKAFLFFCVLCPALAIHWTIARDKLLKE